MELQFRHNEQSIALDVRPEEGGWRVCLPGGEEHKIRVERHDDVLRIQSGTREFRVPFRLAAGFVEVCWQGRTYRFADGGPRAISDSPGRTSGRLTAPMTGIVIQVHAGVGDAVSAYQPLLTVEAMKVLVAVEAPFDGVLSALHAGKGDRVEMGALVAEVAPVEREP